MEDREALKRQIELLQSKFVALLENELQFKQYLFILLGTR